MASTVSDKGWESPEGMTMNPRPARRVVMLSVKPRVIFEDRVLLISTALRFVLPGFQPGFVGNGHHRERFPRKGFSRIGTMNPFCRRFRKAAD